MLAEGVADSMNKGQSRYPSVYESAVKFCRIGDRAPGLDTSGNFMTSLLIPNGKFMTFILIPDYLPIPSIFLLPTYIQQMPQMDRRNDVGLPQIASPAQSWIHTGNTDTN